MSEKNSQDALIEENKLQQKDSANNSVFVKFCLILCAVAMATTVLAGILIGFVANRKVKYEAEYADKLSFYQGGGFDLQVRGATLAQAEEISAQQFVSNAVKMSQYKLNVSNGSHNFSCDVALFDSLDDLRFTEFTAERIVSKKTFNVDAVFVDYRFCKLNNVSLGDTLTVRIGGQSKQLTISRVYRTDYLFSEGVVVATRETLNLSETSALSVYIKSDNKTALVNYLQDYKPLGTLVAQTQYQSDEQYQQYLDAFYAKQYYSTYVTDLSVDSNDLGNYPSKISSAATTFYVVVAVVGVVCSGVSLATFLIKAKNKKDQIYVYIQDHGNKTIFWVYTIFNIAFAVLTFVCMLVVAAVIKSLLFVFASYGTVLLSILPALLVPSVAVMISYAVVAVKIKRA